MTDIEIYNSLFPSCRLSLSRSPEEKVDYVQGERLHLRKEIVLAVAAKSGDIDLNIINDLVEFILTGEA